MKHSLEDKRSSIATDPLESGLDDTDLHGDTVELRRVVLGPGQHGIRLDKALAEVVPEFSRSYLQQLIEAGHVTVNDRIAGKQSATVRCDDRM